MSSCTAVDAAPALERLRAAVDELVDLPLWRLSDPAGPDLLAELEKVGRRLAFTGIRIVADIEARNIAREQAGITTAEFLRQRLRISPSEAKARLRAARELVESVTPSGQTIPATLPGTAAGVSTLSLAHARAISRAVEKLPTGLDPTQSSEVESTLAGHAHDLDPAALSIAARRVHAILDPDGVLDSDKPRRRELAFVRDVGGCDLIQGRLEAEGAAVVRTAIDAISAPEPQDVRSPARRRRTDSSNCAAVILTPGCYPLQVGRNQT